MREATIQDYKEVLAIRKVYGGRDYLKDYYTVILRTHKGYVAILNNQIVSFIMRIYIMKKYIQIKSQYILFKIKSTLFPIC